MNTRISVVLGSAGLIAALALGCKSDPTATGVGTPNAVLVDLKTINMHPGDSTQMTAQVVDARVTPLDQPITFTSCDPTVASVHIDPTYIPRPPTSARAVIVGAGLNATCIVASSSGAKSDTTIVKVNPKTFPGSLSVPSPKFGEVVTLTPGSATLQFDTGSVAVLFGKAQTSALILTKSPSSLTLAVPTFDPDSLRVQGVVVTYAGVTVNLATAPITGSGSLYPGTSTFTTAFDLGTTLPPAGQNVVIYPAQPLTNNQSECPEFLLTPPGFTPSTGPCLIFKFTLAAPDSIDFTIDWPGANGGNPDIDIYACSDSVPANFGSTCFEDGGAGATGAKPQSTGFHTYPAGTHYFVIEYFSPCDGAACPGDGTVSNYELTIAR